MMRCEFEQLTGFYPTADLYAGIEKAYMDSGADKKAFCAAYKANKDGIAEMIRSDTDLVRAKSEEATAKEAKRIAQESAERIAILKYELNSEQGWKPYENKNNVSQADYEGLAKSAPNTARYMTDEEAIGWVAQETGFSPERIEIIKEIAAEEISRSNRIRHSSKMLDRRPIYCATDYLYIRFNVQANVMNYYEMWGGQLRPFLD